MKLRLNDAIIAFLFSVTALLSLGGCSRSELPSDRVVVQYWEKWSGFEREAMRELVDEFNASQDRIHVEYLSMSEINRKLMLAAAGGNPPDLAGLWSVNIPAFASNGALIPLEKFAAEHGISEGDYLPSIWSEVTEFGRLWALPTTPGANALHWNKALFREAGLDPDAPPRTIAQLEQFNEQITRFNERGEIEVLGHSPREPGWWTANWAYWFGGDVWNGEDAITVDSPASVAALEWMQSYPERFGADALLGFGQLNGAFASPENPFFRGRIAMVLQGPWMFNFINNFAPEDFDWGVAPFPATDPERYGVTIVEADVIVIPKGAKHPDAAFEFLAWLQQPENMEKLVLKQLKFSPLAEVSDGFYEAHPNPKIRVYRELAESEFAGGRSRFTTYTDFERDMSNAFGEVAMEKQTGREAAEIVQERQSRLFNREYERWLQVRDSRMEEWDAP